MRHINIPGFGPVNISDVILDYNGTIAIDGGLMDGVKEKMIALSPDITFHVVTADTFGSVKKALQEIPCTLKVLSPSRQDEKKRDYLLSLKAEHTMAAGNGANDALMLEAARIGVAVLQKEGLAIKAMNAADLVVPDILDLFDLLSIPERLIATLRT